MVDINRNFLLDRYRRLRSEIELLEKALWGAADAANRHNATSQDEQSLLARIDEIDAELVVIERLLPSSNYTRIDEDSSEQ